MTDSRHPRRRCLRDLWVAGLISLALGAIVGTALVWWIARALPDLSALSGGY